MMIRGFLLLTSISFFICLLLPRISRAQAEFESRHFTTSDGVELHYMEAGSGPTLVFVPGWTMPAEVWEHQMLHFVPTHRVVAFDPRGHGRSDKPAFGYHPTQRARDIEELLLAVGPEPAVLVGWSIAVSELLVYAREYGSDRIRALVLVDHVLNFDEDPLLFVTRFESVQSDDREEWTRGFVEAIFRDSESQLYREEMARAALSMPTNAAAMITANFILLGPWDLRPPLEALDRPVLFVASSQDWAVTAADEVRAEFPEVRVEVLEDTGHALFVERPERFNEVLETFLAGLP